MTNSADTVTLPRWLVSTLLIAFLSGFVGLQAWMATTLIKHGQQLSRIEAAVAADSIATDGGRLVQIDIPITDTDSAADRTTADSP